MRQAKTLLSFLGLGSYYGLTFGCALGIAYYLIIFQLEVSFFIIYFAILGALCGGLLGGFNGIILGIMTLISHEKHDTKDTDFKRYKLKSMVVSIVATLVGSYLMFTLIFSLYSEVNDNQAYNPVILLATLMAVGAAGYVSQIMSTWYWEQTQGSKSDVA